MSKLREKDGLEESDDLAPEQSDLDEMGCCYPKRCCIPGPHFKYECYTAEMYERAVEGCE